MAKRSKGQELAAFEITFYEKLVNAYPDFVDALIPLADAYTRQGLHEQGLQIDLRLSQLKQDDPLVWYNLACSYSLLNQLDESIGALQRAFELGYRDLGDVRGDPDLLNLRQSPKHRQVLHAVVALSAPKVQQASHPGGSPQPPAHSV